MNIRHLTALLCLLLTTLSAHSKDLRELLGKVGEVINNTENPLPSLGDMAEDLLNGSDINLKELKGQWIVEGSAVSFRSDNLLQNVGGSAAASIIENKLDPYFEKYGLTGSILTIDAEGKFALKIKGLTLTGKITKQKMSKGEQAQKGNFIFTFDNAGALAAGNVTTFITRRTNGLNIMFDATKLQDIMNAISSYANTSTAKAVSQLLNQYDGICVGFSLGRSHESAK